MSCLFSIVIFALKNFFQTMTFVNGSGSCHVALQEGYGLMHISNYVGGSFVSLRIDSSGEMLEQVFAEYYGKGNDFKKGNST